MKTIQYIIVSFIVIAVAITYLSLKNTGEGTTDKDSTISVKTIEIKNGFGYQLIRNGNIIIKQENIPAVKGKLYFCSEKDAQTIAEIIKNKIENKESPSISYLEIVASNISLNCPQNIKNDIVP